MHDTECKINLGIIKNQKNKKKPWFPEKIFTCFKIYRV